MDHSTVLGVDGIIPLSWLGGLEDILHMVLIILYLSNVTGNITLKFYFTAFSVGLKSCHVTNLLLVPSSWCVGPGMDVRLKACTVLISNSAFSDQNINMEDSEYILKLYYSYRLQRGNSK